MTKKIKHVFRGGSWYGSARDCESVYRHWVEPGDRFDDLSFRPAFRLKRRIKR